MRETVKNSQFSIYIKFANNANGHIRRICTRRLIFVSIRQRSGFFDKIKGRESPRITHSLAPAWCVMHLLHASWYFCIKKFFGTLQTAYLYVEQIEWRWKFRNGRKTTICLEAVVGNEHLFHLRDAFAHVEDSTLYSWDAIISNYFSISARRKER